MNPFLLNDPCFACIKWYLKYFLAFDIFIYFLEIIWGNVQEEWRSKIEGAGGVVHPKTKKGMLVYFDFFQRALRLEKL